MCDLTQTEGKKLALAMLPEPIECFYIHSLGKSPIPRIAQRSLFCQNEFWPEIGKEEEVGSILFLSDFF